MPRVIQTTTDERVRRWERKAAWNCCPVSCGVSLHCLTGDVNACTEVLQVSRWRTVAVAAPVAAQAPPGFNIIILINGLICSPRGSWLSGRCFSPMSLSGLNFSANLPISCCTKRFLIPGSSRPHNADRYQAYGNHGRDTQTAFNLRGACLSGAT